MLRNGRPLRHTFSQKHLHSKRAMCYPPPSPPLTNCNRPLPGVTSHGRWARVLVPWVENRAFEKNWFQSIFFLSLLFLQNRLYSSPPYVGEFLPNIATGRVTAKKECDSAFRPRPTKNVFCFGLMVIICSFQSVLGGASSPVFFPIQHPSRSTNRARLHCHIANRQPSYTNPQLKNLPVFRIPSRSQHNNKNKWTRTCRLCQQDITDRVKSHRQQKPRLLVQSHPTSTGIDNLHGVPSPASGPPTPHIIPSKPPARSRNHGLPPSTTF